MKNKTKNTPIVKTNVVDGVKHINLGTIDLDKQYGHIPTPSSKKSAEIIDEVNNYLFDLQRLIEDTFTKLSIWRLTQGSNEVLEKYNNEAEKLYEDFYKLLGMTPDILTKTAKVYKVEVLQEIKLLYKVNRCFIAYDKLNKKALQKVDKNNVITVLGCDSIGDNGNSPTLNNATVISKHKANRFVPSDLNRLIFDLGDLLDKWELYRGDERIDDGSLSAVFARDPQDSKGLQEDVIRRLQGEPTGKLVASIYHILLNKRVINCKQKDFVRRLHKHGIDIKYDAVTKYNDELDLDCFNSIYL